MVDLSYYMKPLPCRPRLCISNKLGECAGHCGTSVSELHNGLEKVLSLSKVKVDVANINMSE